MRVQAPTTSICSRRSAVGTVCFGFVATLVLVAAGCTYHKDKVSPIVQTVVQTVDASTGVVSDAGLDRIEALSPAAMDASDVGSDDSTRAVNDASEEIGADSGADAGREIGDDIAEDLPLIPPVLLDGSLDIGMLDASEDGGSGGDAGDASALTDAVDVADLPPTLGPCSATKIPFNDSADAICMTPPCRHVTCTSEADGSLLVTYAIDVSIPTQAWGVCSYATNQDFAQFDSAYGASGIVEVVFCVEGGSAKGSVNLWYGKDPLRKKLALVLRDEVLSVGCYVRYFSPSQAHFPNWSVIPSSCADQCGAGTASCSADFRAALEVASSSAPDYDLSATHLQLAAEDTASTATGTIRLNSVKYLSNGCLCSDSNGCTSADRPLCRKVTPEDCGPWPTDLLPGVCGPTSVGCSGPPGVGFPCTVSVNNKVCSGLVECVEGQYVCPASLCN